MLKQIVLLIMLLYCAAIGAQTGAHKPLSIYNNYPWQGQKGYNCCLTFYGHPVIEAGIMKPFHRLFPVFFIFFRQKMPYFKISSA